jgi:hypothetical protein
MFDLVFTGDASKAIFNGGITFVIVLLILAGFCSAHLPQWARHHQPHRRWLLYLRRCRRDNCRSIPVFRDDVGIWRCRCTVVPS